MRPEFALSIRQPWAWLICHAGKDIENRSWPTKFRGPVLIHAGKTMTQEEWDDAYDTCRPMRQDGLPKEPMPDPMWFRAYACGGIVGEAEIVDCVEYSPSPWFCGRYGFVLRHARPLPFQPCRGALGFFTPVLLAAAPPRPDVAG